MPLTPGEQEILDAIARTLDGYEHGRLDDPWTPPRREPPPWPTEGDQPAPVTHWGATGVVEHPAPVRRRNAPTGIYVAAVIAAVILWRRARR